MNVLLLAAALALLALLSWLYYRPQRTRVLAGLRLAALALLALALVRPVCSRTTRGEPNALFLTDNSCSMQLSGKAEWTRKAVRALGRARVTLFPPSDTLDFSAPFTDIAGAFPPQADACFLLSDGWEGEAASEDAGGAPPYPVYPVLPEGLVVERRTRISLSVPRWVYEGEDIPVEVRLAAQNYAGALSVRGPGLALDTTVATGSVTIAAHGGALEGEGNPPYLVRFTTRATPGAGDTAAPTATGYVEVRRRRGSVLVLANGPSPFVGVVRRWLEDARLTPRVVVKAGGRWLDMAERVAETEPPNLSKYTALVLVNPDAQTLSALPAKRSALVVVGNATPRRPLKGVTLLGRSATRGPLVAVGSSDAPDLSGVPPPDSVFRLSLPMLARPFVLAGPDVLLARVGNVLLAAGDGLYTLGLGDTATSAAVGSIVVGELTRDALSLSAWTDKSLYAEGEGVRLRARALLPTGEPAEGVTALRGDAPLARTEGGYFVSRPLTLPLGEHTLTVRFTRGGKTLGTRRTRVRVENTDLERYDVGVDTAYLASLAERTGGRLLRLSEVDSVLTSLATRRETRFDPLTLWVLLVLGGALVAEWALRRARGMR